MYIKNKRHAQKKIYTQLKYQCLYLNESSIENFHCRPSLHSFICMISFDIIIGFQNIAKHNILIPC